ncbi:MAG: response regulator [Alphaproteobacteria bacterium]
MTEFPKRVVYVDDEPQARRIVKDALGGDEDDPHFLVTCATGRELIARLRELQPELILLDLRMPDMNGPDTIDALRKNPAYNNAPVIFVTERQRVKMIEDYKALGVIGVIYKPLEPANIRAQIEKIWQERVVEA